jgi:hypothetical protein
MPSAFILMAFPLPKHSGGLFSSCSDLKTCHSKNSTQPRNRKVVTAESGPIPRESC